MIRAVSSQLARRTAKRFSQSTPALSAARPFHVTAKTEDEAAAAEAPPRKGFWEPIYAVPIGIALAVPALKWEWVLVNEETQLAACFIAFTALVYKNFGGVISDALEEDGKRIIAEHNAVEDEIIGMLEDKIEDIRLQSTVVADAQAIKALKLETYEKLNAAGKIKPQHHFKAQMERILAMVAAEEVSMQEKVKVAMMQEATAAVKAEFASSDALKKESLTNAIAQLKGAKTGGDPVKSAYLKFFKEKAAAAAKIDEKAETAQARASIVTKLNAVAKNEGFYFEFGADGKPKMVV